MMRFKHIVQFLHALRYFNSSRHVGLKQKPQHRDPLAPDHVSGSSRCKYYSVLVDKFFDLIFRQSILKKQIPCCALNEKIHPNFFVEIYRERCPELSRFGHGFNRYDLFPQHLASRFKNHHKFQPSSNTKNINFCLKGLPDLTSSNIPND